MAVFAVALTACGNSEKPSLQDSLAAMDAKEADKANIKPKPRPTGLEGPTEAEFKAWDRKDPEGEKHLYKKHEIRYVHVPQYEELSVKNIYPLMAKDAVFMSYFPDKYAKGKGPPRDYFFNILNT